MAPEFIDIYTALQGRYLFRTMWILHQKSDENLSIRKEEMLKWGSHLQRWQCNKTVLWLLGNIYIFIFRYLGFTLSVSLSKLFSKELAALNWNFVGCNIHDNTRWRCAYCQELMFGQKMTAVRPKTFFSKLGLLCCSQLFLNNLQDCNETPYIVRLSNVDVHFIRNLC